VWTASRSPARRVRERDSERDSLQNKTRARWSQR